MQKQDNTLPDIESEEVNGLQNNVGILKSIRNRKKLTITDNPQNENIWEECFNSYTESKWYCNYIAQITNLADNGDSVRKGFDRS